MKILETKFKKSKQKARGFFPYSTLSEPAFFGQSSSLNFEIMFEVFFTVKMKKKIFSFISTKDFLVCVVCCQCSEKSWKKIKKNY